MRTAFFVLQLLALVGLRSVRDFPQLRVRRVNELEAAEAVAAPPPRALTADDWQKLFKAYAAHVAGPNGSDCLDMPTDVRAVAKAGSVDVAEFQAFVNAMQVERFLAKKGKKP